MKAGAVLAALLSTGGLAGCGLSNLYHPSCVMTFPDQHLLTLGGGLSPAVAINCCGDARQYTVAQADNNEAVDIFLGAGSATNNGPIPGLRLSVAVDHCEAARQGDCTPVPDQTTPSKVAGEIAQPGFVPSEATASVAGRNIRLTITVTNAESIPGVFGLDVTQGQSCPAP
jgi:hypothetical protein